MNRHGRRHVVATHAKTISMTGSDGIQSCRNLLHKDDCLRTPQSWQNDLQQINDSECAVSLFASGRHESASGTLRRPTAVE
jgi:hypothetical protein